ncbi:MAG: hypothetical protein PVG60_05830 [Desulfarculaceae bacterium]|jgi:hypothetical protein
MKTDVLAEVLGLLSAAEHQSRNRNFEDFTSQNGKRVLRLYRLYHALLKELEEAAARPEIRVSSKPDSQGLMLSLEDPKVSYRRTCLVPWELAPFFQDKLKALFPDQPQDQAP